MKFFFTGLFSGIISGMGIGGGTILIPAITFLSDVTQKQAQSVNLICFLPTAAISIYIHSKNKSIEKQILKPLILFGIIGAIIGSFTAIYIDNVLLKKAFGFFLLFMSAKEFFAKK